MISSNCIFKIMEPSAKKSRTGALDEKIDDGLMSQNDKHNDNSTMDILNNDCLIQIFEYLPISDRIRLERVNKRWREVSLTSWRSFKNLDFKRDTWGYFDRMQVTTIILNKVLDRCCKYITRLDMSDSNILVEKVYIGYALERCHNLTSVNFNSFKLNSQLLGILILNCAGIEEFSTGQTSTAVSDYLFERTILSTYENLKVLKFKNHKLTGWCLKALNSTVEVLHLEYCSRLDLNYVQNVIPMLQKLRTLSLQGSLNYCFENSYLTFLSLTNIKVLDISNNSRYIDDACLIRIADSCRNLQRLDLSHNYKVTDEGLATMASPNLEYLRIDSLWHVKGTSLSDLPCLKSLSCRDCFKLDENLLQPLLNNSNTLKFLDLSNCPKVSKNLLETAKRSVDSRQNDVVLVICMKLTDVNIVSVSSKQLKLFNEYSKIC